jgi:hypothetical protein
VTKGSKHYHANGGYTAESECILNHALTFSASTTHCVSPCYWRAWGAPTNRTVFYELPAKSLIDLRHRYSFGNLLIANDSQQDESKSISLSFRCQWSLFHVKQGFWDSLRKLCSTEKLRERFATIGFL